METFELKLEISLPSTAVEWGLAGDDDFTPEYLAHAAKELTMALKRAMDEVVTRSLTNLDLVMEEWMLPTMKEFSEVGAMEPEPQEIVWSCLSVARGMVFTVLKSRGLSFGVEGYILKPEWFRAWG